MSPSLHAKDAAAGAPCEGDEVLDDAPREGGGLPQRGWAPGKGKDEEKGAARGARGKENKNKAKHRPAKATKGTVTSLIHIGSDRENKNKPLRPPLRVPLLCLDADTEEWVQTLFCFRFSVCCRKNRSTDHYRRCIYALVEDPRDKLLQN